jgi:hypothetical protein
MIMKCKAVVLLLALGLVTTPSATWASFVHNSNVEGRYFRVWDNRSSDYEIANSWRWWLQAHRAIRANSRLARKFVSNPLDLKMGKDRRGTGWEFLSGSEKIKKFGLTKQHVENQPAHAYTLQIATFQRPATVLSFLKQQWLGKGMNHSRVYKKTHKQLFFFASAENAFRSDPIYSEQVVVRGPKLTRICYGIYESKADANADQRILQRYLGLGIRVLRKQLTTEIVRRVVFEPIEGKVLDGWESEI